MSQNPSEFITGRCQACDGALEFPAQMTGEAVECPHCHVFTLLASGPGLGEFVPAGDPSSDVEADTQSAAPQVTAGLDAATLANSFTGEFTRPNPSFGYSAGLVIVTVAMLLLPLIYLMLIAGTGWATWYWGSHFTSLIDFGSGLRFPLLRLAFYVAPLFAGGVMILFMVKPLFAGRPPHAQPLALHPAVDGLLFSFVTQICRRVGAPFPARIDVSCDLNASAGFRRGMFSFLGNDLVLTIGMPLAAGMTVQQLTGVLAHELGHFSQGFGMRLTYLIQSINAWFARVAYQRDSWDYALDEWAETSDARVGLVIVVAQLGVWFSRLILKGLMYLGHGIGCYMLREMEYHADLYEIRVSGSDTFESVIKRLHALGNSLEKTYREIRPAWNLSKTLPDNIPALLALQDARMPVQSKIQIEDSLGLAKTGLFDSHPSAGDRIRRARVEADPGVFRLDAPASSLFANFEVLSKQVTTLHYAEDLGIPLALAKLRPSKEYVESR